eukprot:CAMPEP_0194711032 /NCGR_PEP_ID=MMETSP0296-20130528/3437_1 /TAXON_ID=39354 /ORGANISM="Heterosigma akashiwo, Strain CCMP2393" /LENGTH=192 /DNA_ID=CAMNT_0039608919 /DNA_START=726 /DNA_END=1302 /DNA_ORIENTATION=+
MAAAAAAITITAAAMVCCMLQHLPAIICLFCLLLLLLFCQLRNHFAFVNTLHLSQSLLHAGDDVVHLRALHLEVLQQLPAQVRPQVLGDGAALLAPHALLLGERHERDAAHQAAQPGGHADQGVGAISMDSLFLDALLVITDLENAFVLVGTVNAFTETITARKKATKQDVFIFLVKGANLCGNGVAVSGGS